MKKTIQIFVIISIFLAIILLPIFVLVWHGDFVVQKVEVLQISNIPSVEMQTYAKDVLGFLLSNSDLPSQMTSTEMSHMQDVKNLFVIGKWLLAISTMILVMSYFILKNTQAYWRSLRAGSVLAIIIIILLGIAMSLNFENIFIHFHQIFFPQGNWTFLADSLMIQVFPENLFKELGIILISVSLFLAFSVFTFSHYKIRKGTRAC